MKKFNPYSKLNRFIKNKTNIIKEKINVHSNYQEINSRTVFDKIPTFYQGAFIDPGIVSCAIRIVRYFPELDNIEVLWFSIHNFGHKLNEIMKNTDKELNEISNLLNYCHYIIIEHQFKNGVKDINYRSYQHLFSTLSNIVRDKGFLPIIYEVDVSLKTSSISGPKNKNENGGLSIKDWSVNKAYEINLMRNDYLSNCILNNCNVKQKEDLSDTICYEYAWWMYLKNFC
jgi:hypothetical protein